MSPVTLAAQACRQAAAWLKHGVCLLQGSFKAEEPVSSPTMRLFSWLPKMTFQRSWGPGMSAWKLMYVRSQSLDNLHPNSSASGSADLREERQVLCAGARAYPDEHVSICPVCSGVGLHMRLRSRWISPSLIPPQIGSVLLLEAEDTGFWVQSWSPALGELRQQDDLHQLFLPASFRPWQDMAQCLSRMLSTLPVILSNGCTTLYYYSFLNG